MAAKRFPQRRKNRKNLTYKRLRQVLLYLPKTGEFFWREFPNAPARVKNSIRIKRQAGAVRANGYHYISIDCRSYLASRLAWFYLRRSWPENEIDHKDRDTSNNKWQNLRHATRQQNMANMKRSLNNRSGYKGVGWSKSKERWRAYIMIDYVFYHLGYFDDPKTAHEAYKLAASTHRKEFARFA